MTHFSAIFLFQHDRTKYIFFSGRASIENIYFLKKIKVLFLALIFLWLQSENLAHFCMSAEHECKKVPNFYLGAIKNVQNATFIVERLNLLSCSTLFCTDFIAIDFSTSCYATKLNQDERTEKGRCCTLEFRNNTDVYLSLWFTSS